MLQLAATRSKMNAVIFLGFRYERQHIPGCTQNLQCLGDHSPSREGGGGLGQSSIQPTTRGVLIQWPEATEFHRF